MSNNSEHKCAQGCGRNVSTAGATCGSCIEEDQPGRQLRDEADRNEDNR